MPKYATAKRRTRRAIGIGSARAGSNVIDKLALEAYYMALSKLLPAARQWYWQRSRAALGIDK
jgi:hypothetical protein